MTGRHRAPAEHHVGRAIATTGVAAAVTTGSFLAITPAQAQADLLASTPTTPSPAVQPAAASSPASTAHPATVTVQPGNTLSGIAETVQETWPTLYDNNRTVVGADPNRIFPGQVLQVASRPAPAPAHVSVPTPPPAPAPAPTVHVAASAPPPPPPPAPPVTVAGNSIVALAQAELGKPYVWAGAGPDVFDCSGLVQFVFAKVGVYLPHSSLLQSEHGLLVTGLANARPGDLVFFSSPVDHVGIYIGNGQMIAAPEPGEVVKQQSVYETPSVIRRVI